jgi:membrane associated rhomboid family serine protease/Zn-finger nucleic acid-binding protein
VDTANDHSGPAKAPARDAGDKADERPAPAIARGRDGLARETANSEDVSAQCPACHLHALVPVRLAPEDEDALRWRQLDPEEASPAGTLLIDTCPVCFGAWFDKGELDLIGDVEVDPAVLRTILGDAARRLCPRGHGPMLEHKIPELVSTPIDRCATCKGVWLDGHERRKLALSSTQEGQGARNAKIAKRGVIWAAQLITQLPVEVENPARGTPWVVYALLVIELAGFLLSVFGVLLYRHWAVIAGQIKVDPVHIYTLFTHQFFHANWMHLLGNAYFLYIFGDNVEHLFGRRRFCVLFFGAGIAGGALHVLLTQATATPVIGASGAIAGIMAAYLWSFPNAKLFQVIPFTPIQVKIPAWVYLGVWVVFQAVMALFSPAIDYAWFSHLGGFLFGAAMTPLVLRWRRRQVAAQVEVPAAPYCRD